MLNEFYKYIADNIVGFFQGRKDTLHPGERYCLRLDTAEMVEGVDSELRNRTALDHIQGTFHYKNVYDTFTIRLSSTLEIVVASKINGMTDDFLATLRNAELTDRHFPILMITHSPIDTITSGTGDLAANGMPFHAASIVNKVKDEIRSAELSSADRILLELELERKQGDRFSDKSSLFEYSDLLTVLGRGYVIDSDFAAFSLLTDDLSLIPNDKIRERLLENHQYFDQIDRVFRHGNIADTLEKEYDDHFIKHLVDAKKTGTPWYENYTFTMVKSSRDKIKRKLDNPLSFENEDIEAFSESAIEYSFPADTLMFIRNDGDSRAKQRRKNILIFNPDQRTTVTIRVRTNIAVKQSWVDSTGASTLLAGKELSINMSAKGCSFSRTDIKDVNNNISYRIKICVLNLSPDYLENLRTCYFLDVPKNVANGNILYGLKEKCTHSTNERCLQCAQLPCKIITDVGCLLKLFEGFEGFTVQPHQGHEFGDVSMLVSLDGQNLTFLGVAKSGREKITKASRTGREIIQQVIDSFIDARAEITGIIYPGVIDDQLKQLLYHEAKIHNKRLVVMDNEFMMKLLDYYLTENNILLG